jgi:O-antigen ligase
MRFAIPGLLGTVKSLFTGFGSDPSIQGRTDDYSQVGTFVGQHPWLGRGFGTFLPKTFFFLDNQYLGIVIEAGFIGLTAMVLLFVVGVFTARGARRRSSDEEERDLYQALAASIATVMIGYITFDGFGFPMISGLLFFLLGCAGAAWRSTRTQRAAPETSSAAAPRALALAAGTH